MNEIFLLINSRKVSIDTALDALCCGLVNVAMTGNVSVEMVRKHVEQFDSELRRMKQKGYPVGELNDPSNAEHGIYVRAVKRQLAGFNGPDTEIIDGLKKLFGIS